MQKSNQKEIFTENCRLVRGKKGTLMKRVINRGLQYDGRAPQYTEKDLQLFRDGKIGRAHV